MSSDSSFASRLATAALALFGLACAALGGLCALFAHWGRKLTGRTDPIRVVRDPGDSQEWRKGNGSNPPLAPKAK